MKRESSQALFRQAATIIPGGVNSPVRACKAVGGEPLFIDHGQGCMLYDVDGNAYVDYIGSWGPLILGHRHPSVLAAVQKALEKGMSFGAPTALEIELAQMVIETVPSVEVIRMVNSGTEATMSAIRLARGATGKDKIVKFDGCYHGHADCLLVEAGSGVATLGIPGSPGVPTSFVSHTLSLPFNDIQAVTRVLETQGSDIACVILEPVAGNMGLVPPIPGFLEALRELTTAHDVLLIFDEVMTGFRVAKGGAQALYGITPDLTCFGKIIGGGMPVGAYGGKRELMARMSPEGPVYQAGTLSGNPVAMAAGIATLKALQPPGYYESLDRISEKLLTGLRAAAQDAGIPVWASRVGSMLGLFFTDREVHNFADAKTSDPERFSAFYQGMRQQGIYLAPSQFEALFVSSAHTPEAIDQTIAAAQVVMSSLT